MLQHSDISNVNTDLLLWIGEGLPVRDRKNRTIGKVRSVYFADDYPATSPLQSLLQNVPESLRTQLIYEGFIEIDNDHSPAPLCAASGQIAELTYGFVKLNTTRGALAKL